MNTIIRNGLMLFGGALMLTACSENSWNDKLDGFEEPTIGKVEQITYSLTAADYSAIAGNSANKALAEADGEADALKAIGTSQTFTSEEQAHKYLPAFLASTSFPNYTLDNGSSVKLTYNVSTAVNPTVSAINAGTLVYDVTEDDYKAAWDSDEDFINAFCPEMPASAAIPAALKRAFPDAKAGEYAAVNYDWSAINPIFSTVGGGDDEFKLSNALGSVSLGQTVDVKGIVTGICTRGFILTDKGGSILVYGQDFDETNLSAFSLVEVSGPVSSYGTAFQIALGSATVNVVGEGEYEYPAPVKLTPADVTEVCNRTEDAQPFYAEADVTVSVSGNYVNLLMDGLEGYDISAYYALDYFKDILEDGVKAHVSGWVIGKSGSSHCNMVLTDVNEVKAKARARAPRRAPAGTLVTEDRVALFRCTGSNWQEASDVLTLQPADYTTMGQSHPNLSNNSPETLLPLFLKLKFPFAQAEDVKTVCYNYYSGGSSFKAMEFAYNGSEWTRDAGATTEQYTRIDGVWQYNPSIVLDLPADKSTFCKDFYQACVDYVFEYQCKPLGDTDIKSGKFWVTSYGNNEYWSGTSAYQTNVDIRPAAARAQYAAGFEGMTDEEVQRFIVTNLLDHTFPYVLGKYYPDFGPIEGMDVTLTVNYVTYDGGKTDQQVVYKVVGKGQFERISSTIFGD